MALEALIYISQSTLDLDSAAGSIDRIVVQSLRRNPTLELTGALIYTGGHFAQRLEGPSASIDELMEWLGNDVRHTNMTIVERYELSSRLFANWSMAYSGPSLFIERQIHRVLHTPSLPELRRAGAWLTDFMHEITTF